jgi:putative transposase
VLGQHRSTQRKVPRGADDEQVLSEAIIALAKQYGRYGYRRVTALLCHAGWTVNHKRVERIWRREGLKVPQRQPKRGRLWLNDGSCIRLRPEYPGHVWAYDFVEGRTHDGRKFRILTIIDEASRECLGLIVARQLKHEDVLAALADLFVTALAANCSIGCARASVPAALQDQVPIAIHSDRSSINARARSDPRAVCTAA